MTPPLPCRPRRVVDRWRRSAGRGPVAAGPCWRPPARCGGGGALATGGGPGRNSPPCWSGPVCRCSEASTRAWRGGILAMGTRCRRSIRCCAEGRGAFPADQHGLPGLSPSRRLTPIKFDQRRRRAPESDSLGQGKAREKCRRPQDGDDRPARRKISGRRNQGAVHPSSAALGLERNHIARRRAKGRALHQSPGELAGGSRGTSSGYRGPGFRFQAPLGLRSGRTGGLRRGRAWLRVGATSTTWTALTHPQTDKAKVQTPANP